MVQSNAKSRNLFILMRIIHNKIQYELKNKIQDKIQRTLTQIFKKNGQWTNLKSDELKVLNPRILKS